MDHIPGEAKRVADPNGWREGQEGQVGQDGQKLEGKRQK
jgi:hypothetical protein